MYPGRRRVGRPFNAVNYPDGMPVYDGVDWFWGRSMREARAFLREQHPDVVVFQWWTGAVLHSYARLAADARAAGARVLVECHEVLDTGEARLPLVSRYVRSGLRRFLTAADGLLLHSAFDRAALDAFLGGLGDQPIEITAHGPYDHLVSVEREQCPRPSDAPVRLLFFGTIRPYKGLEDLVAAVAAMPEEEAAGYRLSIVGETWEGWDHPVEAARALPHPERVEILNRYVADAEVAAAFEAADVVVLPYRRSSSSGPLHIAMAAGLPVVVSEVGGLSEAVDGYSGAVLTAPGDPAALLDGIRRARELVGRRFTDPRSWAHTRAALGRLAIAAQGHAGRPVGTPVGRAWATIPAQAAEGRVPALTGVRTGGAGFDLPSTLGQPQRRATVTVVIACYDEGRFAFTVAAIRSVLDQAYPHRLVVVVDHNESLLARLRDLDLPDVALVANTQARGASGARNTAALRADTDLVAFLDDDARAEPGWLEALVETASNPGIVGAGGLIRADWSGPTPSWFPPTFGWAVGASMPVDDPRAVTVRNVWAGSMIVRTQAYRRVGGFRENWGKLGAASEPEDTDLCIRLSQAGEGDWAFVPASVVFHHVPVERAAAGFFFRRCWSEGAGKARLRGAVGHGAGALSSEGTYLRRTVPKAVAADLRSAVRHGDGAALARAGTAVLGALVTVCAFGVVSLRGKRSR
jgi:glycosyltransferase involved in cell wall biosynthesis/GT2 family glycosyltransferase